MSLVSLVPRRFARFSAAVVDSPAVENGESGECPRRQRAGHNGSAQGGEGGGGQKMTRRRSSGCVAVSPSQPQQREQAEARCGGRRRGHLGAQGRTRKLWRGGAWARRPGEEHAHGLQRQGKPARAAQRSERHGRGDVVSSPSPVRTHLEESINQTIHPKMNFHAPIKVFFCYL